MFKYSRASIFRNFFADKPAEKINDLSTSGDCVRGPSFVAQLKFVLGTKKWDFFVRVVAHLMFLSVAHLTG